MCRHSCDGKLIFIRLLVSLGNFLYIFCLFFDTHTYLYTHKPKPQPFRLSLFCLIFRMWSATFLNKAHTPDCRTMSFHIMFCIVFWFFVFFLSSIENLLYPIFPFSSLHSSLFCLAINLTFRIHFRSLVCLVVLLVIGFVACFVSVTTHLGPFLYRFCYFFFFHAAVLFFNAVYFWELFFILA